MSLALAERQITAQEDEAVEGLILFHETVWKLAETSAEPAGGPSRPSRNSGRSGRRASRRSPPALRVATDHGNSSRADATRAPVATPTTQSSSRQTVSPAARACRDWCHMLKAIPLAEIPPFAPPKSVFEALSIPKSDPSPFYDASRVRRTQPYSTPSDLANSERDFVVALGAKLTEASYKECKARIFACHRWRTEEDGIFHTIEASQQCCPVDVKVVSIIHRWFDSSKLFNQSWNNSNTTQRPANMGTLYRATPGRNGRTTTQRTKNIPRRFS